MDPTDKNSSVRLSDTTGEEEPSKPLDGSALRRSLSNLNLARDTAQEGIASGLHDLWHKRFTPNLQKFLTDREPLLWLLALVIGLGVGAAALLFRLLIGLIQYPWLGTMTEHVATAAADVPWIVILLVPAFGGLIVGQILQHYMPGRRAHGVADVIEARAIRDCNIETREGLLSALVAAISLGTGNSAGREGPVVHLGAALASFVENFFTLPAGSRRTLLACGVAAAVSASFNAPIAGVLFAHEIILAHFARSAFVPIVIASVAGTIVVRLFFGDALTFASPVYEITSYLEFPAFALLGVTCAVVAIIFQSSMMMTERVAWSFNLPLWVRPVIGGLLVGAIAIWFPEVLGVGYDATDKAVRQDGSYGIAFMVALIVAKTAATSITLASRFGGGIFSPALYLGAMTGGAFGLIAASVFPEIASSYGLYAILGMGAVAAAILGAPISTAVVVFELTGGYEITIALLVSVSIATALTHAVHGDSFFHWQLSTRGLFLQEGPHMEITRRLLVNGFMTPLGENEEPDPVDPDGQKPWLLATDTVESALRMFDRSGFHRLPVVDSTDTTRVVAWADHLSALSAFNQALIESHVEEHR